MKKHKSKIIAGVFFLAVLTLTFWWSGDGLNFSDLHNDIIEQDSEVVSTAQPVNNTPSPTISPIQEEKSDDAPIKETEKLKTQPAPNTLKEEKDNFKTDPATSGKPAPSEPQDAIISDKELTCTLSVRCDTILKNIGALDSGKTELVPKDGVIFAEKTVTFYEGESVFNLLVREMKKNKIHMEFVNTPIYNSAYIEGIGNLYEFDCGELSGWMYKVNDWFPNYGCSCYQLKAGDKVEWVYTCDLGSDVGGNYSARNGNDKNE